MRYPLTISTIGDHIEHRYEMRAYCTRSQCWHGADVDLEALAEKLGRDTQIVGNRRLGHLFRCAKCGHKGATFRIWPPGLPVPVSTFAHLVPKAWLRPDDEPDSSPLDEAENHRADEGERGGDCE